MNPKNLRLKNLVDMLASSVDGRRAQRHTLQTAAGQDHSQSTVSESQVRFRSHPLTRSPPLLNLSIPSNYLPPFSPRSSETTW